MNHEKVQRRRSSKIKTNRLQRGALKNDSHGHKRNDMASRSTQKLVLDPNASRQQNINALLRDRSLISLREDELQFMFHIFASTKARDGTERKEARLEAEDLMSLFNLVTQGIYMVRTKQRFCMGALY